MESIPLLRVLCVALLLGVVESQRSSRETLSGDPKQCVNGPCGPGNDHCGPVFDHTTPQFHVRDLTCGENDPNFPLYDPLHQLYHHFWQSHLAEPQQGAGQGPVIGHAVSSDLVHWAHLPVAVWNDQAYDNVAIYTGSATIVDGVPTMVYPGLCRRETWPACGTGTLLAIALPLDHANDPLLVNWTKPAYNPIVENTQRDPSTAWKTSADDWRLTTFEGKVYTSPDFMNWSVADGGKPIFPEAECPDFFPLPAFCSGNGCSTPPQGSTLPTHVHKQSSNGQDYYTLGTYVDGPAGSAGTWTPTPGVPVLQPLDASALLSVGMKFYASKSFFDPVFNRRIYWGWALVAPASTQTLPRETTYHAGLQRLVFNPIEQLEALRTYPALFEADSLQLAAGTTSLSLGRWPGSVGNQSEFTATFVLPGTNAVFGVEVMVGTSGSSNVSTPIMISYDPVSFTANVSVGRVANLSYYMPGVDLPGADYSVVDVSYTDPHICQAACTNDTKCAAYTYVVRPPLHASCCLKGSVPSPNPYAACTSGAKSGAVRQGTPVPLVAGDKTIDIRVFVDNTFAEVFIAGGRVALTLDVDNTVQAGINILSTAASAVQVIDVGVWHLQPIWQQPEEILNSRRSA